MKTPIHPITIEPNEAIRVAIDGYTIGIAHVIDTDGEHALQIGGLGCELQGQGPGLYYPVPSGTL